MTENSKIKEGNPFRVPENYFNEVKQNIYAQTTGLRKENNRTKIRDVLRPALMLAAAMLAFAIISYSTLRFLFPQSGEKIDPSYSELIYQFDESEIIDQIAVEDAETGIGSVDQDNIINYLIDNNIEDESIIEILN